MKQTTSIEIDFIQALGYRAFDTRLKRISDKMVHSVRKLYRKLSLDIEPNWYLIFLLVEEEPNITMADIAEKLKFSHPSVVAIVKKMIKNDYIITEKDENDQRRLFLQLTPKAEEHLPMLKRLWESYYKATFQILNHDETIMKYLDAIDAQLENLSIAERVLEDFNSQESNI